MCAWPRARCTKTSPTSRVCNTTLSSSSERATSEVLDSEVPFLYGGLLSAPKAYSWTGLNGRAVGYLRDGMVYTRGAADDFDRYAAWTGDEGWAWDQMAPYFFKLMSTYARKKDGRNRDHHNTQGQFNPALHGTHGRIPMSLSGFPWPELTQRGWTRRSGSGTPRARDPWLTPGPRPMRRGCGSRRI
ncbi:hypothetical protein DFH09DRAFT_1466217 [Mycena vulgaris]|nr:hypothetical protein DFH09DRAFT_1466217 [Mycena vulgaris]